MGKWLRARSCPPHNHLPPAELSPYLTTTPTGKIKAIEKIELELDEFGVPIPEKAVELVGGAVAENYVWPEYTNVHHLAWPRRSYAAPIERAYRGSPTLMIHMPVQPHNLLHEITLPPPMPSLEVMRGRVDEERQARNLFAIGRRAVRFYRWSEHLPDLTNKSADDRWLDKTARYYKIRGQIAEAGFYEYLEQTNDGTFGILPERSLLETVPLEQAIRHLGKRVAAEAVDFRRTTQELTAA